MQQYQYLSRKLKNIHKIHAFCKKLWRFQNKTHDDTRGISRPRITSSEIIPVRERDLFFCGIVCEMVSGVFSGLFCGRASLGTR